MGHAAQHGKEIVQPLPTLEVGAGCRFPDLRRNRVEGQVPKAEAFVVVPVLPQVDELGVGHPKPCNQLCRLVQQEEAAHGAFPRGHGE